MPVSVLLLLPALILSCPSELVISSSADTKIDRGNQNYTSSTCIPYVCDWRRNDAVCIWDSFPRSNGVFSFVEHFPLEAWMEHTVLSATVYFRLYYRGSVYINGKFVCEQVDVTETTCEFRNYLAYGKTNEFRIDVENYWGNAGLIFEVRIGFSQNLG